MSNSEVSHAVLALGIVMACANLFGYLFERWKQPRLIGEILAGFLLGPTILGAMAPGLSGFLFGTGSGPGNTTGTVLSFLYWLGLLLLMFISGTQANRLLSPETRRATGWLLAVGTPIPFFLVIGAGWSGMLPLSSMVSAPGKEGPTLLILAIATAVTSIPVISRIFFDLKILNTRFASLVLGTAVLEDVILWAVLAVATALAHSGASGEGLPFAKITTELGATLIYIVIALLAAPVVLRRLNRADWNVFMKSSSLGYLVLILFLYAVIADALQVNLVFAAFLAGFGVVGGLTGTEREKFSRSFEALQSFSTSTFVPVYFAMVGFRLNFGTGFSPAMTIGFLLGSSALAMGAKGLAARLAGYRGLDLANIAITSNARGGPGIVLASVAFDAGIINAAFYTTLVLTAVLTSQASGIWLRHVLAKGRPLLSSEPEETWKGGRQPVLAD